MNNVVNLQQYKGIKEIKEIKKLLCDVDFLEQMAIEDILEEMLQAFCRRYTKVEITDMSLVQDYAIRIIDHFHPKEVG